MIDNELMISFCRGQAHFFEVLDDGGPSHEGMCGAKLPMEERDKMDEDYSYDWCESCLEAASMWLGEEPSFLRTNLDRGAA